MPRTAAAYAQFDTMNDHEDRRLYCTTCSWSVSSTDELSRMERSKSAIDHYLETGHTIESIGVGSDRADPERSIEIADRSDSN